MFTLQKDLSLECATTDLNFVLLVSGLKLPLSLPPKKRTKIPVDGVLRKCQKFLVFQHTLKYHTGKPIAFELLISKEQTSWHITA